MSRVRELLQRRYANDPPDPTLGKSRPLYIVCNRASSHDSVYSIYGSACTPIMYSSVQPSGRYPTVLSFGGTDEENKFSGPGRNAFDRGIRLQRAQYATYARAYATELQRRALLRDLIHMNVMQRGDGAAENAAVGERGGTSADANVVLNTDATTSGARTDAPRPAGPSTPLPCVAPLSTRLYDDPRNRRIQRRSQSPAPSQRPQQRRRASRALDAALASDIQALNGAQCTRADASATPTHGEYGRTHRNSNTGNATAGTPVTAAFLTTGGMTCRCSNEKSSTPLVAPATATSSSPSSTSTRPFSGPYPRAPRRRSTPTLCEGTARTAAPPASSSLAELICAQLVSTAAAKSGHVWCASAAMSNGRDGIGGGRPSSAAHRARPESAVVISNVCDERETADSVHVHGCCTNDALVCPTLAATATSPCRVSP